jgi:hypothetical protein
MNSDPLKDYSLAAYWVKESLRDAKIACSFSIKAIDLVQNSWTSSFLRNLA